MDGHTGADTEQRSRADIAALLRADIDAGVYPVGSKLPSYRQLATQLGAAPNTVGEAVRLLAREGRVAIRPQSRVEVTDPAERPADASDQMRATRADLVEVQGELRAIRQAASALEDRLADLIGQLPPE